MSALPTVSIAGAGIGGLAAALALQRMGWVLHISEQTPHFEPIGAGIQLGPNVSRILQSWGLERALQDRVLEPERLEARHALQGHRLGVLPLGQAARSQFGAPYWCVHRADLHQSLLQALDWPDRPDAVSAQALPPNAALRMGQAVTGVDWPQAGQGHSLPSPALQVRGDSPARAADVLVGADGLWSQVRASVWQDGPPQATGHVAYRALVPMRDWPLAQRQHQVTVWLGPALHVVQYPVRGGEAMNVAVITHAAAPHGLGPAAPQADLGWDHAATAQDLSAATARVCPALRAGLEAVTQWRRWTLWERPPLSSPDQMVRGRVALLGDAAHPMRPYLAQGAGMAIEDAQVLAQCLGPARSMGDSGFEAGSAAELAAAHGGAHQIEAALQRYAALRWQRNARVQARARRNGRIFHLAWPASLGRDWALRLAAPRLMNLPWLYGYVA